MKLKRILRFYFYADKLNATMDRLILKNACASGGMEGDRCGEALCRLIAEKGELGNLWDYLDGVMSGLDGEEVGALRGYAAMRVGLKRIDEERQRLIKRAKVKFMRRAKRLDRFEKETALVGKYYCLF